MHVNIDKIMADIAPWDLTIEINGQKYATRAPELGEMIAFDTAPATRLPELLGKMFQGQGPQIEKMSLDQVMATVAAIAHAAKKRSSEAGPFVQRAINAIA